MYLARILRDPDPVNDPNAAVGDPPVEPKDDEPKPDPKKAAPSPAAGELDLNAKVTFNGRKISVSELVAAAQYSHELQTSVAAVFAANTPIAGASEEDITNYLSQNFQDSSGNPGGGDPEPDDRITKLEKELKTQKAAALQGKLDGALDQALDKNPTVRVYLDAAKRLGGDAQVEKAKAALRKAIRKETLGRFRLRYALMRPGSSLSWRRQSPKPSRRAAR
jgi:hypothetical protein